MKRFRQRDRLGCNALAAALVVCALTLTGCESREVGSIKLPDVKDRSEVIPGYNPAVKSPYSAGAKLKKKVPEQSAADKALPANNHPSL